jgi:hypothetical protein
MQQGSRRVAGLGNTESMATDGRQPEAHPATLPRGPSVALHRGAGTFGPFFTLVEHIRSDGVRTILSSRRHRKQLEQVRHPDRTTWWSPQSRGWWIGVLFAVGSMLFALGAMPGYAGAAGGRADSITFFIGSL